ncbi:MAG: hypothetical protein ABI036_08910 [Fibrobacteria bacterium]
MRKSGWIGNILLALSLPMAAGAQGFKYWDVSAPDSLNLTPTLLSATGLYTGTTIQNANKVLVANATPFEVNSPLWSDDAHKARWVLLKAGTSINYSQLDDYWGYPDSTVFIKQFAIDTVPGDTTTRLLWETRLLINHKEVPLGSAETIKQDRWYGYSYKWNRDGKDAVLVSAYGADDSVKFFPNGRNAAPMMKKWRFPSHEDCTKCHVTAPTEGLHGRSVLGFFTAQLNRPSTITPGINQLQDLFNKAVLTGTPSMWNDIGTPRWRAITDTTASLDIRARSYIAANCSGCHGTRGLANNATFGIKLSYDFYTMEIKMEVRHLQVRYEYGLDTLLPKYYPKTDLGNNPAALDSLRIKPAVIVPGYPEKSLLLYRQLSRNTEPGNYALKNSAMPPLATFEVNVVATDSIAKWIRNMDKTPAPNAAGIHSAAMRTALRGPGIQGRRVILPAELVGTGLVKVAITGIDGRTRDLRQVAPAIYALPDHLTPGVYIIKVDKKAFTRYLF